MVTFTPMIVPSQRKADGTYNVKIRVTYKRMSRRIATNITAYPNDVTSTHKLRDGEARDSANEIVKRMRDSLKGLDLFALRQMSVDDVIRYIDNKNTSGNGGFDLDFIKYGRKVAATKGTGGKAYNSALNCILRFTKGKPLFISDINVRFLRTFEDFIRNEPKMASSFHTGEVREASSGKIKGDCRAVSMYLSAIRHIFNKAKEEFNEPDLGLYRISSDPFEYYSIPKPPAPKRRNKSKDFIQKLINSVSLAKGSERAALEVFLLSFALEGMNLADIFSCAPAKKGWIIYNRQKTARRRMDSAEHHVFIPKEIQPIVEKYKDNDGIHMFSFHRKYKDFNSFTNHSNTSLRRWRDRVNVEEFTMYSARHSWASLARKCKVEMATIDKCLAHVGNFKIADVYTEPNWDLYTEANNKVLALFDWNPLQE